MHSQKDNRENLIHERSNILKNEGYRGFSVTGLTQHLQHIRVTVKKQTW